jgi:hypothetical protein
VIWEVASLHSLWARPNESREHQVVNLFCNYFAVNAQGDLTISKPVFVDPERFWGTKLVGFTVVPTFSFRRPDGSVRACVILRELRDLKKDESRHEESLAA